MLNAPNKFNHLLLPLTSVPIKGKTTIVVLPFIGTEVNGSRRWLNLFGAFNIQPSEIAKVFIPIYLCGYCLRRKEQLENSWYGFLKPLILTGICCILLLLEPDVGATAVLFLSLIHI